MGGVTKGSPQGHWKPPEIVLTSASYMEGGPCHLQEKKKFEKVEKEEEEKNKKRKKNKKELKRNKNKKTLAARVEKVTTM